MAGAPSLGLYREGAVAEYTTALCKKQQTEPYVAQGSAARALFFCMGLVRVICRRQEQPAGSCPRPGYQHPLLRAHQSPVVAPRSNSTLKEWGGFFIQQCPQSVDAQSSADGEGE